MNDAIIKGFNLEIHSQCIQLSKKGLRPTRLYIGRYERSILNWYLIQQINISEEDIRGTSELEYSGLKIIDVSKCNYFKVEGD